VLLLNVTRGRVTALVLLAALLVACEAFPILPPPAPPQRPVTIEVTNRGSGDVRITVSRPGNVAEVIGTVEPDVVPPGTKSDVIAYVPWDAEWAIFADGAEYMGSRDVQELTGAAPAELEFLLIIKGPQDGHWGRP
jgi:hypothetical protein